VLLAVPDNATNKVLKELLCGQNRQQQQVSHLARIQAKIKLLEASVSMQAIC
jgi:hypothetical protein